MAHPLMHTLRMPWYRYTRCNIAAPKMTDVRRALIDQGALTECPVCFPQRLPR